jgi:hypothetical protein
MLYHARRRVICIRRTFLLSKSILCVTGDLLYIHIHVLFLSSTKCKPYLLSRLVSFTRRLERRISPIGSFQTRIRSHFVIQRQGGVKCERKRVPPRAKIKYTHSSTHIPSTRRRPHSSHTCKGECLRAFESLLNQRERAKGTHTHLSQPRRLGIHFSKQWYS